MFRGNGLTCIDALFRNSKNAVRKPQFLPSPQRNRTWFCAVTLRARRSVWHYISRLPMATFSRLSFDPKRSQSRRKSFQHTTGKPLPCYMLCPLSVIFSCTVNSMFRPTTLLLVKSFPLKTCPISMHDGITKSLNSLVYQFNTGQGASYIVQMPCRVDDQHQATTPRPFASSLAYCSRWQRVSSRALTPQQPDGASVYSAARRSTCCQGVDNVK